MHRLGSAVPLVAIAATVTLGPVHASGHASRHTVPRVASSSITFGSNDYAFTGLPAEARAGWVTLRMINRGREMHMLAIFSVPHGYTPASFNAALLADKYKGPVTEWGGPNAVAPGDTGTVTLHLEPGDYALGCFVQSADRKTHFAKGMTSALHVVPTTTPAASPVSNHLVTLTSYAIAMTGPALHPGIATLQVRNTSPDRHDLIVLKVLPGHTTAEALAWFTNPPTGTATAVAVTGTTALHTGEDAFVTGRFTPGTYVLVCWMYTNGKVHHSLGMKHVFTVAAT